MTCVSLAAQICIILHRNWLKKAGDSGKIISNQIRGGYMNMFKLEAYQTFLDYKDLERKGSDIVSRLERKDRTIQNMMCKQEKFDTIAYQV